MKYAVVIHNVESSSCGVAVTDLRGPFSDGDTLDEAFDNVVEAITGHINSLFMDRRSTPASKPLEDHQRNDDLRDALCWRFADVDMDMERRKAVRVNIAMPSLMRAAVDGAAARSSESKLGFLIRAALDYINRAGTH